MSTKNPRINVMLEEPVYMAVRKLAEKENISLSLLIRDMVKEQMEKHEDIYLAAIANERKKTATKKNMISADAFWKKVNV